jgi:DNA processing protein
MFTQQEKLLLAISQLTSYYPHLSERLLQCVKSLECIYSLSTKRLSNGGFSESFVSAYTRLLANLPKTLDWLTEKLEKISTQIIQKGQKNYPKHLSTIYDPPPFFFARGRIDILLTRPCLAIVGTRKATSYADACLSQIIPQLVSAGITIVSGLAPGVDTLAHRMTMESGGYTAAVLGSGILAIEPHEKCRLAEKIIENGGVILTEFSPCFPGAKYSFPLRNRIIAGLCSGTLVVEAGEKSGALITASCALENGREVMAIPGDIGRETSKGSNALIRQGAIPIRSADDIFEVFHVHCPPSHKQTETSFLPIFTPEEKIILQKLESGPKHVEQLMVLSSLQAMEMNRLLAMMEVKGYIQNTGGQNYQSIALRPSTH